MSLKNLNKQNILNDYLATSQVLPPKEFNQEELLNIIFEQMAYEIADAIIKRKKELPKEECLFVLTCKIYKFADYKKAHPKVFKICDAETLAQVLAHI